MGGRIQLIRELLPNVREKNSIKNAKLDLIISVHGLCPKVGGWTILSVYCEMLQADLELSEPVDSAHFDEKPLPFRVAARIDRLASPLL